MNNKIDKDKLNDLVLILKYEKNLSNNDRIKKVKQLLKAGANVNEIIEKDGFEIKPSKDGKTYFNPDDANPEDVVKYVEKTPVFFLAFNKDNLEIANLLIKNGANLNLKTEKINKENNEIIEQKSIEEYIAFEDVKLKKDFLGRTKLALNLDLNNPQEKELVE